MPESQVHGRARCLHSGRHKPIAEIVNLRVQVVIGGTVAQNEIQVFEVDRIKQRGGRTVHPLFHRVWHGSDEGIIRRPVITLVWRIKPHPIALRFQCERMGITDVVATTRPPIQPGLVHPRPHQRAPPVVGRDRLPLKVGGNVLRLLHIPVVRDRGIDSTIPFAEIAACPDTDRTFGGRGARWWIVLRGN